MDTKIILGLGYGDEGKGITTDYLCRKSRNPLVVRFSGGHQAGHTVVREDGTRHVFSSFGAGTLRGIPTYWSRHCSIYPIGFFNELAALLEKGVSPKIYVDALALVTTPYDVFHNRNIEQDNQHGSCGLGFGATVARDRFSPNKLYARDLFYPDVLEQKLKAIHVYYQDQSGSSFSSEALTEMLDMYLKILEDIKPCIEIVHEAEFFNDILENERISDLVFEGSQGILLDMDHGFFPNVTHAHTTSRNAMDLIRKYGFNTPDIYYVSRAYQTRHGNGYLSNEELELDYNPNPNETNQYNPWQGKQRCAVLDLDMLDYALQCDANYAYNTNKHLVITCLDQLDGMIVATRKDELQSYMDTRIMADGLAVDFQSVLESWSDCSKGMKLESLTGNMRVS